MNYTILAIGLIVQVAALASDTTINMEHVLPVQAIDQYINELNGNKQPPLSLNVFTEQHEQSGGILRMAIDHNQNTFTLFSTPVLTTYFGASEPGQPLDLLERFALSCAYHAATYKKKSWLPWSIAFHPEVSTRGKKLEALFFSLMAVGSLTGAFLQLDNSRVDDGTCSYLGNPVIFGALGGVLGTQGLRGLEKTCGLTVYTSRDKRAVGEAVFRACKDFSAEDLLILSKNHRGLLNKTIYDIIRELAQANVQDGR